MRDSSKSAELLNAFRQARNQVTTTQKVENKTRPIFEKGYNPPRRNNYTNFEEKYANLNQEVFATFNSVDLAYYFVKIADKAGQRYVIASIAKEASIFKRLLKSYTALEIGLMIEFLFSEEQTYIENPSPNVLGSSWCNTLFIDAKKWVNDEPITSNKKKTKTHKNREWQETEHDIKIGEWE